KMGLAVPSVRLWAGSLKILTLLNSGFNSHNLRAQQAAEYLLEHPTEYRIQMRYALNVHGLKFARGDQLRRDPLEIGAWTAPRQNKSFLELIRHYGLRRLTDLFGESLSDCCVTIPSVPPAIDPDSLEMTELQDAIGNRQWNNEWKLMRQHLTDNRGRRMDANMRRAALDLI